MSEIPGPCPKKQEMTIAFDLLAVGGRGRFGPGRGSGFRGGDGLRGRGSGYGGRTAYGRGDFSGGSRGGYTARNETGYQRVDSNRAARTAGLPAKGVSAPA